VGRIISDEELQRIPQEKVEVLARSEEEIVEEERKLRSMKDKFAKLILEIPKEKPKEAAVEEAAVRVEEKPAIDKAKAEEIKELSDNFKKITMKKDEMEKRERIRKMKKEIEDMLESG
jgi:outer membrane protein assembly factor BamA